MHDACEACGRRFNREAGYLLGSIYFNYGITASLVVIMYFAMFFGECTHRHATTDCALEFRDSVSDVVFSLCAGLMDRVRRALGPVAERRRNTTYGRRGGCAKISGRGAASCIL